MRIENLFPHPIIVSATDISMPNHSSAIKLMNEIDKLIFELSYSNSIEEKLKWQEYIGTSYEVMALASADIKAISKSLFPNYRYTTEECVSILDYLWNQATNHETMSICLFAVQQNLQKKTAEDYWKIIKKWLCRVDNWAHSDFLSSLYAKIVDYGIEEPLVMSSRWNSSDFSWERRQSVVLMAYLSRSKKYKFEFVDLMKSIEKCFYDDNYFVQKGVGWALRDIGKIYPVEMNAYLSMRSTELSSIAFATATEKIDKIFKEKLKALRKQHRFLNK